MKTSDIDKKKKGKLSKDRLQGLTLRLLSDAMWMLIIAVLLFIGIVGAKGMYSFGYSVFTGNPKSAPSEELSVTIEDGASVRQVAKQLKDENLIDDVNVFVAQSAIFDLKVKPGTYTVNRNNTSRQLLEVFNNGPEGQAQ